MERNTYDTIVALGLRRTFKTIFPYAQLYTCNLYNYSGDRYANAAKNDGWPAGFDRWRVQYRGDCDDVPQPEMFKVSSAGTYTLGLDGLSFYPNGSSTAVANAGDEFGLASYALTNLTSDIVPTLWDKHGNVIVRSQCNATGDYLTVDYKRGLVYAARMLRWRVNIDTTPQVGAWTLEEMRVPDRAAHTRKVTDAMAQLGNYYKFLATLHPDDRTDLRISGARPDTVVLPIVEEMVRGGATLEDALAKQVAKFCPEHPEKLAPAVLTGVYFATGSKDRNAKGIWCFAEACNRLSSGLMSQPNVTQRAAIVDQLFGRTIKHEVMHLWNPTERPYYTNPQQAWIDANHG